MLRLVIPKRDTCSKVVVVDSIRFVVGRSGRWKIEAERVAKGRKAIRGSRNTTKRRKKGNSSAFGRRFRGTLSKVEKLSRLAVLRRQKRKMRAGYGWQRRGKEGGVWGCAAQGE